MKTIRLLYPDYLSGGLNTYYFGANLLAHIIPKNKNQQLVKVDIIPPDGSQYDVVDGIYAKDTVIANIEQAMNVIETAAPDKIITIGGDCIVSQAPFDYLHGIYNNLGIIWIDAHPDVSTTENGYPNAHAMVLGSLMGNGEQALSSLMKNSKFQANEILYIGLQGLHDYQKKFLKDADIDYKIQTEEFISNNEIKEFMRHFDHVLVHLDIDVLDANQFHSTYFANKDLVGDGADSGKMTMHELSSILDCINKNSNIVGFTIAEYLPFDEYQLHKTLANIEMFTEDNSGASELK